MDEAGENPQTTAGGDEAMDTDPLLPKEPFDEPAESKAAIEHDDEEEEEYDEQYYLDQAIKLSL